MADKKSFCCKNKGTKCLFRVHVWSSDGDVPVALVSGKESSARGDLQGWISTQKQNETANEIPFYDSACESATKRETK